MTCYTCHAELKESYWAEHIEDNLSVYFCDNGVCPQTINDQDHLNIMNGFWTKETVQEYFTDQEELPPFNLLWQQRDYAQIMKHNHVLYDQLFALPGKLGRLTKSEWREKWNTQFELVSNTLWHYETELYKTTYMSCSQCGNEHLASEGLAEIIADNGEFDGIVFTCSSCLESM